ncbi:MAG: hypothetical protein AB1791_10955 [Chloroflexota bacterium]
MVNDERRARSSFIIHHSSLVVLLFVALTAVVGWPALTHLDSVIIGNDIDLYINPWADWWTLKALREPDVSFWRTDYLFYPNGVELTYHSFSHFNTLVSLALRPLLGVLPAYNLAILLNYVLNGLSMFHLVRYLTRSAATGVMAGIVFAFNSLSLFQSAHPVLLSVWCLPWATLYFLKAWENDERGMMNDERKKHSSFILHPSSFALKAAVFVFLAAAASTLLLYLLGLWLGFLFLYLTLVERRRPPWSGLVVFGLVSLALVLPLLYPLLKDWLVNHDSSFAIDPDQSIVSDIISPVMPHWHLWLIRGLYFGILGVFFLLIAHRRGRETRLWYLLLIGSYLMAIGPRPLFNGHRLDLLLPWSLPIAPLLRNMYRMNILVGLALAVLVAYGWLVVAGRIASPARRRVLAVLVAAVLYADFAAPQIPTTPAVVSRFYTEYLAAVPNEVALAALPTGRQQDKRYMYYQTLHGHQMTGGVVSRHTREVYSFILDNPLLRAGALDFGPAPIPADAEAYLPSLAEAGIGYLVLHKNQMSDALAERWRVALLPEQPVFEDSLVFAYDTGLIEQR